MNEKEQNIWKRLYDAADFVKAQKPWEYLDEYEFVTIELPGRKEAAYCAVVDFMESANTISVFETPEALFDLIYLLESDGVPWHQESRYENCIDVIFADREELEPADRDMIKELGLKYRGKRSWTMFRSFEKGFCVSSLNLKEAERLALVLEQLGLAISDMRDRDIEVDFEMDGTLLRRFSKKGQAWETIPAQLTVKDKQVLTFKMIDEITLRQLKKAKKLRSTLQIDVMHHVFGLGDYEKGKQRRERFAMAIEEGDVPEKFLTVRMDPLDEEIPAILDLLISFIQVKGRPMEIMVRDDIIRMAIGEFCEEIGIKLIVSGFLDLLDYEFEVITGLKELDDL